jgi:hypothetical protein
MLLPPRPLRLRSSFVWLNQLGGIFLLLAGIAVAIGYGWWQADEVKALLTQSRIWRDGVAAQRAEVGGQVRTKQFIFHSYELDVSYVDASGATHEHELEFDTLLDKVDEDTEVSVRHLADAPERFALSWAMEVKTSRWMAIIFLGLVGVGLIGGSLVYLGCHALRLLANGRRCARRSDEVVVQITQVTQQVTQGKHNANVYHYQGQLDDGRPITGKVSYALKHEPLFADPTRQTMIALVSPENLKRPLSLRGDFHPFALSEDEQAAVRTAIARNIVATPAGTLSDD